MITRKVQGDHFSGLQWKSVLNFDIWHHKIRFRTDLHSFNINLGKIRKNYHKIKKILFYFEKFRATEINSGLPGQVSVLWANPENSGLVALKVKQTSHVQLSVEFWTA